jgi:hypothetical protein
MRKQDAHDYILTLNQIGSELNGGGEGGWDMLHTFRDRNAYKILSGRRRHRRPFS